MFKQKYSLPGSQGHPSIHDGDDFAGPGERHADMTWHVIGAFLSVDEPWGVFGNEFFEKEFQITAGAWIRVFHDHQTGAGVSNKDGDRSIRHPRPSDDFHHLAGDLGSALASGGDREIFRMDSHG